MTDIHPHWHSTQDEREVPGIGPAKIVVNAEATVLATTKTRSASRLPAAIVGIIVVLGVGTALLQGTSILRGQSSPDSNAGHAAMPVNSGAVVIHVTSGGLVPPRAIVMRGGQIIWQNDQNVPQVFRSSTLKDGSGHLLYTSPIFSGEHFIFAIPETAEETEYPYNSITSAQFAGSIVITASLKPATNAEPLPAPLSVSADSSSIAAQGNSSSQTIITAPVTPASSTDQAAATVDTNNANALIPVNPYTIGNKTNTDSRSLPTHKTSTLHHATPPRQPASGPEIWIVCALSIAAVLFLTRKQLMIDRR